MYSSPFFITTAISNNSFSYEKRQKPQLYVPELVEGKVEDVKLGDEIVFEDFNDDGNLRSCNGLKQFVKTSVQGVPAYIFDNHNHAFAFWNLERSNDNVQDGSLLIHVDQHKDTRIPDSFLSKEDAADMEKVFQYTNTVLHVGDFIPAAQHIGLVKDIIFIDSESSIDSFDFTLLQNRNIILDIDLDFFQPELDYIGNDKKLQLIQKVLPKASVITFATSPFFIEQELALLWLRKIVEAAEG